MHNVMFTKTKYFLKTFRIVIIIIKDFHLYGSNSKENIPSLNFAAIKDKSKNTYLEMVKIYADKNCVHRRGHVEFIYFALKHMEEFGVNKDLKVYKALIDVMPKGKFIARNIFQAEFMHYPKQQQCIIDLLEQMEDNGVLPDVEIEQMLLNIFGKRGFPLRKLWRMMYWMPKFKYASPWYIPNLLPEETMDLAKLAIERISSVDVQAITKTYYFPEKSFDNKWIVSSQSPIQRRLIENHDESKPIYLEGPQKVWLRSKSVDYFILMANAESPTTSVLNEDKTMDPDDVSRIEIKLQNKNMVSPLKSVHEQEDGTILAVCATETSNKDSLLAWVRCLEKDGNPKLENIPIVFGLKSSTFDQNLSITSS